MYVRLYMYIVYINAKMLQVAKLVFDPVVIYLDNQICYI